MDYSLDEVDTRIVEMDTVKANQEDVNNLIVNVTLDETTGVMTFEKFNGTVFTLQTAVGKIAVNFDYVPETQKLILYHKDGTQLEIDLSDLVNEYEFDNTDTITHTVLPNGHITSKVVEGSIEEKHLRPNYLADIKVVQETAAENQRLAENYQYMAEGWAVGTMAGKPVKSTDVQFQNNSKYYSDIAGAQVDNAIEQVAKATNLVEQATKKLSSISMWANFENGHLYYDTANGLDLSIDLKTGHLMYEVN